MSNSLDAAKMSSLKDKLRANNATPKVEGMVKKITNIIEGN